jgi:subtilisin family serine protease
VIDSLAKLSSVSSIKIAPTGQLKRPIIEEEAQPLKRQNGVLAEWNIEHMGVPQVWEMGINGSGVVVGITDTGVRGTHELIRDQYKNDGRSWRDPYNQYNVPTDKYNHGTHTTGSVVGK